MSEKHNLICLIGQLGTGGTEKQLSLFLKHLDCAKYNPLTIVSGNSDGKWKDFICDSLKLPVLSLENHSKMMKLYKFRKILSNNNFPVVLSWSFFTNAFSVVSGKSRFIGALRGDIYTAKDVMNRLHWKMSLAVPEFFTNSSLLKKELIENGKAENNIYTVKNIFESEKNINIIEIRNKIRQKFDIPDYAVVVAGVGRDTPEKDFDFFVESFKIARESDKRMHALIIGSAGDSVRKKAEKAGIADRFSIAGEVESTLDFLPAADIFFLSSKTEGMPNALLEAVYSGCTAVCTDVGGVKDFLEGVPENIKKLIITENGKSTDAAEKLSLLSSDSSLRNEINKSLKSNLKNYSFELVMNEFNKMLEL